MLTPRRGDVSKEKVEAEPPAEEEPVDSSPVEEFTATHLDPELMDVECRADPRFGHTDKVIRRGRGQAPGS
jgi:hypothetical protein